MLPNNVQQYVLYRPLMRNSNEGVKRINKLKGIGYDEHYIQNAIIAKSDAHIVLIALGLKENAIFYQYYLNWCDEPKVYRSELLYGLSEILDDYQNPFWERQYPNIKDKYLRLSSIEGEYSYFYDKETDALYGVDWGEMDDFMAGKIDPLFTSFYDFLEWYYSENDN